MQHSSLGVTSAKTTVAKLLGVLTMGILQLHGLHYTNRFSTGAMVKKFSFYKLTEWAASLLPWTGKLQKHCGTALVWCVGHLLKETYFSGYKTCRPGIAECGLDINKRFHSAALINIVSRMASEYSIPPWWHKHGYLEYHHWSMWCLFSGTYKWFHSTPNRKCFQIWAFNQGSKSH